MRGQFSFLGIAAPERRKLWNDFLRSAGKEDMDWGFVDLCWARVHREFQYLDLGVEYLVVMRDKLVPY